MERRLQLGIGSSHDTASSTAIAAIRRAAPNKLLPTKTDTAAPTVAGDDVNLGFVDEFHVSIGFSVNRKLVFQSDFCPLPFYFIFFLPSSPSPRQKKSPERGFSVASAHLTELEAQRPAFSLCLFVRNGQCHRSKRKA